MADQASTTEPSTDVFDASEWMTARVEEFWNRNSKHRTTDEDTTKGNIILPKTVRLLLRTPVRQGTIMSRRLAAEAHEGGVPYELVLPANKSELLVYRQLRQANREQRVAVIFYPGGQLVLFGDKRCIHKRF
jgi:hypothetical protein